MLHKESNPSFSVIADDILKLMDKLCIDKIMVAHKISLIAPERVSSMILTGH